MTKKKMLAVFVLMFIVSASALILIANLTGFTIASKDAVATPPVNVVCWDSTGKDFFRAQAKSASYDDGHILIDSPVEQPGLELELAMGASTCIIVTAPASSADQKLAPKRPMPPSPPVAVTTPDAGPVAAPDAGPAKLK